MSIKKLATLIFAGIITLSSCGESDTIVEVQVLGNVSRIVRLDVDLTIGSAKRNFKIPDADEMIALPTSFTIQVSPDVQGPVSITIRALDDTGKVIVQMEEKNILAKLAKGEVNRIVVALTGGLLAVDGGMMMPMNRDGAVMMMTGDAGIPDHNQKDGSVASNDAAISTPDAAVTSPDTALPMPDAGMSMDAAEVDAPNGL